MSHAMDLELCLAIVKFELEVQNTNSPEKNIICCVGK